MTLRLQPPRPSPVLLAAFAMLASRLLLALVLIPPWQQADEPAHMVFAEIARSRLTGPRSPQVGLQREILASMHDHDWWRHYGVDTPQPLPDRFYDLEFTEGGATLGMNPTGDEVLPEYYRLAAALLVVMNAGSPVADLYVLRALSAFFALVTLWVAWHAAREAIGEWGAVGVAVMLALHPQFALVATTAGPDALVNLAGACVFWSAVRVIRSANPLVPFTVMWFAAVCGAAADRLGAPLLAAAAVVSAIAAWRHPLRRRLVVAALVVAVAAVFALEHPRIAARWQSLLAGAGLQAALAERAATWDFFREFTTLLFQSWWVVFGWLRYRAPEWWFVVPALLSCAAVFGLTKRLSSGRIPQRDVLSLALAMIALQLAAVYWTFFRQDVSAQGRYLFPFLVPTLILFWTGLQSLVSRRYHRHAAVAVLAAFAVLDALAWLVVGLPAYVT